MYKILHKFVDSDLFAYTESDLFAYTERDPLISPGKTYYGLNLSRTANYINPTFADNDKYFHWLQIDPHKQNEIADYIDYCRYDRKIPAAFRPAISKSKEFLVSYFDLMFDKIIETSSARPMYYSRLDKYLMFENMRESDIPVATAAACSMAHYKVTTGNRSTLFYRYCTGYDKYLILWIPNDFLLIFNSNLKLVTAKRNAKTLSFCSVIDNDLEEGLLSGEMEPFTKGSGLANIQLKIV